MSQNSKIIVEKGKLEQDLTGKKAIQRQGSTSLAINFPVLDHGDCTAQSSAGAGMGPRSGQDQQSGIGTSQDPENAPSHFQEYPGEWTVHDNWFA